MRLDHLLSKEYMSLDRACTIAMTYILSRPQIMPQTQESTDHLDRKAGSLGASRTTALFSFEGTILALVRRFAFD